MSDDNQVQDDQQGVGDGSEQLTDEIAKKYDPERLLKLVSKRAGKGEALDHSIRAKYEKRFGVDLGHVRIYTGEFAEEFNRQRSAYAVTVGSTGMILMGNSPDKSMASTSGQALLAHELTHVAQAKRGLFNKDFDRTLAEESEHEAEQVEAEVAAGGGGPTGGAGSTGDTREAATAAAAATAAKEKLMDTIEQIKQRVFDMAADAMRTSYVRNSIQRRP